jgi:hypothetical protein
LSNFESLASLVELFHSGRVESFESVGAALLLGIAEHVQGDTVSDILLRTHPIHGLLHFAVATVAALHGIGGGREQFGVEKRQGLVQVRRLEFAQELPDVFEPPNARTQFGQFRQGGGGPTSPIK